MSTNLPEPTDNLTAEDARGRVIAAAETALNEYSRAVRARWIRIAVALVLLAAAIGVLVGRSIQ